MTHYALDVTRSTPVDQTMRVRQLSAMFDVPLTDRSERHWCGDVDIDRDWTIGLINGPSGSGKTTLLGEMFGEPRTHDWTAAAVIDDFAANLSMEDIANVCQAVGFNTIPAWMRPHSVLSNGEQFRVALARALIEDDRDPIVLDEFTSVVDRQVAKIGSHAVQKYVRRAGRRCVIASCHDDIIDWLEPDWVLDAATLSLKWRRHRGRPSLDVSIERCAYTWWRMFAPFHYLTAEMNHSARCYLLRVAGRPAVFMGILHRPHSKAKDVWGISRIVTLPDWQGLGLGPAMLDRLGSAYRADGKRLHGYPAHPALIRTMDRSPCWAMIKRPGTYASQRFGPRSTVGGNFGGRPNATFAYCGPADDAAAVALGLHD